VQLDVGVIIRPKPVDSGLPSSVANCRIVGNSPEFGLWKSSLSIAKEPRRISSGGYTTHRDLASSETRSLEVAAYPPNGRRSPRPEGGCRILIRYRIVDRSGVVRTDEAFQYHGVSILLTSRP